MSAFNARLYQSQQLKQEMKINPRLYQAMELLYMPLVDLQQHLKQELAENPFLELTEADAEQEVELKDETEPVKEEKNTKEEIDWGGDPARRLRRGRSAPPVRGARVLPAHRGRVERPARPLGGAAPAA